MFSDDQKSCCIILPLMSSQFNFQQGIYITFHVPNSPFEDLDTTTIKIIGQMYLEKMKPRA